MTVLFDLDNTLIDRNTAYEDWLTTVFKANGIMVSSSEWDTIRVNYLYIHYHILQIN